LSAGSQPAALRDEYRAACDLERQLWSKVKGNHPGQPDHSPPEWRQWLDAANRVQALARMLRHVDMP
jgi:hypothetical protein